MSELIVLAAPLFVVGLVVLTWWLGGVGTAKLDDAAQALARLQRDYLDFEARQVVLAGDGRAALLEGHDARLGLVFAVGDRFATRLLRAGELRAIARSERRDRVEYRLEFPDFANRSQRFVTSVAEAGRVDALLAPLAGGRIPELGR